MVETAEFIQNDTDKNQDRENESVMLMVPLEYETDCRRIEELLEKRSSCAPDSQDMDEVDYVRL